MSVVNYVCFRLGRNNDDICVGFYIQMCTFTYICSKCTSIVYVYVGDYSLPLDHFVLVRSDI